MRKLYSFGANKIAGFIDEGKKINDLIKVKRDLYESDLNYDYGGYGPKKLESYEFINGKYWANPNDISSSTLRNLGHPLWRLCTQYVTDNFIPKHKILRVTNDLNYVSNNEDVLYNLQTLIPYEYKHIYPFNVCKWNRGDTTEFVDVCFRRQRCFNLMVFLLTVSYERIIVEASKEEIEYFKEYIPDIEGIVLPNPVLKKSKNLQKGIDISLDCDEENIEWDRSSPITDYELIKYWVKKLTIGGREVRLSAMENAKKRKEIKNIIFNDDFVKDYYKKNVAKFKEDGFRGMRPIQPEKELLVKRDYLPPIDDLQGENLGMMGHPFWWFTTELILEHFKPRSKIMTICTCSNCKPYKNNLNYKFVKQRMEEGYTDVFISSLDIWPLLMSDQIYNRIYDWSNALTKPFVNKSLIDNKLGKILLYFKKFGYEKIVFYGNSLENTPFSVLINEIKKYIPNCEVVVTEEMKDDLKTVFKGIGLMTSRVFNVLETRKRFDELIGYKDDNVLYYKTRVSSTLKKEEINSNCLF